MYPTCAPALQAKQAVDLSQSEVIVAVGRGIKEQKNLAVAEALASSLGGEIAASRPICDNGWLPLDRQIGSSGQTVAPKLYLALGISGAIQHIVGMKGAAKESPTPTAHISAVPRATTAMARAANRASDVAAFIIITHSVAATSASRRCA